MTRPEVVINKSTHGFITSCPCGQVLAVGMFSVTLNGKFIESDIKKRCHGCGREWAVPLYFSLESHAKEFAAKFLSPQQK